MNEHIGWGGTFLAVNKEFWTPQVDQLLEYCRKLIADARALDLAGYRAGAIPFEKDGYQFVLMRAGPRLWTLEVVGYPPHDDGSGGRIRSARRQREKQERKQQQQATMAARPKRPPRITDERQKKTKRGQRRRREVLMNLRLPWLSSEFRHNTRRVLALMDAAKHNVRAQYRSVIRNLRMRSLDWRNACEQVLYRTCRYLEKCDIRASLEKRIETTPEFASGMRLESRPFVIGRLQIQLNTWAPIDPGFDQIWDTSLFGVRLLESEST